MFETRLLKNMFGPQRDEVKGKCRRLHSKEFYDMYFFTNIISTIKSRTMKVAGHVASMGDKRGAYRGLVGKPKGNKPLGRSEHRCGKYGDMWQVWGTREGHTGFWWGNLKETSHLEDLNIDEGIILNGSSSSGMGRQELV